MTHTLMQRENWDRETDRENICENEGKPRNAKIWQQIIRNYTRGKETDFTSYLWKETNLPTPGSANKPPELWDNKLLLLKPRIL